MKIAIIGRGLIGAAAARHLSEQGHQVWLVGPKEPADLAAHDGPFASHYDEGRITRSLDRNVFWSKAAQASIARYRDIESRSGIPFFNEVGLIMAGPEGTGPISAVQSIAQSQTIECQHFDDTGLAAAFPFFEFASGTCGVFEATGAGHISPRALLRAQVALAEQAGALCVNATVTKIKERDWAARVETDIGEIEAHRVLVATGGMSRDLLPEPLPLKVYARTAALFEVSEAQAAELAQMPSLIYLLPSGEDPYLLPPIRYPDGKFYLKLGGDPDDTELADETATRAWFRSGGSPLVAEELESQIRKRIPSLDILSRHFKPCVTTYTPSRIPMLKPVSKVLFAAVGGCGGAAKSSDEIGRLAGQMVIGHDLPDWAYIPAT